MKSGLTTIEILPEHDPIFSVIWLHGLGADGHDFESIVPELNLVEKNSIHFVFPNAPVQPVTVNGGMEMRAWYDIYELSLQRKVDVDGIYSSSLLIEALIQKEIDSGVPSENILLAGFSQGGVIALHTALRYKNKLAGILALSCYLPTIEQLHTERSTINHSIPVMMAHGTQDPVVDIQSGREAYHALESLSYPVEWSEYSMGHAVCLEEINQISQFINTLFIK